MIPTTRKLAGIMGRLQCKTAAYSDNTRKNFLECIRTRQKPTSDIENLVRSSSVCLLGNVSMRAKTRLDFDEKTFSVWQPEALPFTKMNYRAPWKMEV